MNDWHKIFKESGLKEMIVTDGTTGKVIYHAKKTEG